MTRVTKDWLFLLVGGLLLLVGLLSLVNTLRHSATPIRKLERQQKDVAALRELKERGAEARDSRIKALLSKATVVSEIRPLIDEVLGGEAKVMPLADQSPEAGWVLRQVRIDWSGSDWEKIMNFMTKAENEMRPAWKIVELDLQTEGHAGGRVQLKVQQLFKSGGLSAD